MSVAEEVRELEDLQPFIVQVMSEWDLDDTDDDRIARLRRSVNGNLNETEQYVVFRQAGARRPVQAARATKIYQDEADADHEAKQTDRETASKIACGVDLWHAKDGVPFATICLGGHLEHVPVRSARFKHWLVLEFQKAKGKAPSTDAISIAQTSAEAHAALIGPQHEVFVRVATLGERVYLDLCNDAWEVVEIDADGWRIVTDPPVKFRRPADARPLPAPVREGSLEALRPFVNVPDADDWALLTAWLIGTLSDGPYPLLVFCAEKGSGKSVTTRYVRTVIDPLGTPTRDTPKNLDDLAIAAKGVRVLAFDNLSWLSDEMSNAFCRLSGGGGTAKRTLYTDDGQTSFYAKVSIIVNGIEEFATRGDLLSRAIVIRSPTLATVRGERALDREWETAHPGILGALLDAVSTALRRRDEIGELPNAPRMADFAAWVVASDAIPGFLEAYERNRADAVSTEIDASSFATALVDYVRTVGRWEGTAGQLLEGINTATPDHDRRGKHWPTSALACGNRVRRHAGALREVGVEVGERRAHGRRLLLLDPVGLEALPHGLV